MLENKIVTYVQCNVGARETDFDHKLSLAEVYILLQLNEGKQRIFQVIDDDDNILLSNKNTATELAEFVSSISKENSNIFSKKAKEQGYIIIEQYKDKFLCYNQAYQKFAIWSWLFYDKCFGSGFYSSSIIDIGNKWKEIISDN